MPDDLVNELKTILAELRPLGADVKGIRVDLDRLLDAVGAPRSAAAPLGLDGSIVAEIQDLKRRMATAEQALTVLEPVPGKVATLEQAAKENAEERKWLKRQVVGAAVGVGTPGFAALVWLGWLAAQS